MSVEIHLEYKGGLHCAAVHGPSGSEIVTDAPLDNGGKAEAFSPTDLVATALGVCVLTVMGLVAQRNGTDITGMRARVVKEMASTPVRRIGKLTATFTYPPGKTLTEKDRTRLEAAAKLCPVKASLHPDVQVEMSFVHDEAI